MDDPKRTGALIAARLPVRVRWSILGTPLDYDFSRSRAPLRSPQPSDFTGAEIPDAWKSLLLFGEERYAEGGGASPYLAVNVDTGEVFGLDVERDGSQLYLLNTDTRCFIRTFEALDAALRVGAVSIGALADELRAADPAAFDRSEWRFLAEHLAPGA
jgi:hypothetical protein